MPGPGHQIWPREIDYPADDPRQLQLQLNEISKTAEKPKPKPPD